MQDALRNFYRIAEATINTPGPAPNPYRDFPKLGSQFMTDKGGQELQVVPHPFADSELSPAIVPEQQSPLEAAPGDLRLVRHLMHAGICEHVVWCVL